MKILLVHDVKPESLNGVSVSVNTLAKHFKEMGHDVRFLTLNESIRTENEDDIAYRIGSIPTRFYPGVRWTLRHRGRAFKEIIEWNPDVIHTNCEFSTYFMINRIIKNCPKKPKWIHTFHTDYRYYVGPLTKVKPFTNNLIPMFLRSSFSKPDKLIVPSYKTKKFLYESAIVPSEKEVSVIPCGISVSMDDVDDEKVVSLKHRLCLKDKKVIISLGRLSNEKNIDELLEYFATFCKKHKEYVLLICGLGPALNHLKIKASALKISDKVVFCVNIPHKEVPNYLRLADVFASSSMSETQGMTYYEALVCGIPVIATDKECLKGVVEEGENGYFYSDALSFEQSVLKSVDLKCNDSLLKFSCTGKDFADRVLQLYK
ncbi:MAG: glycosyltransferase [Acutalibacteraceae bacterium]|nr:glycosyltransferase [Acutalibacteraceae bacterium]